MSENTEDVAQVLNTEKNMDFIAVGDYDSAFVLY